MVFVFESQIEILEFASFDHLMIPLNIVADDRVYGNRFDTSSEK